MPSAKLANFIADALTYKYPTGYIWCRYSSNARISNEQRTKNDLVELVCKDFILDIARGCRINKARDTVATTAATEMDTREK